MAVKAESFLVLEKAMSARLGVSWARYIAPITKAIVAAVAKEDWAEAERLVNQIDLAPVMERNSKYVEFIGTSAALFGASKLRATRKTSFAAGNVPETVVKASELIKKMMIQNANLLMRRRAQLLIHLEESRKTTQPVYKAEEALLTFSRAFTSTVTADGKSFIDLASSLHTSRLASWGFTVEAELTGVTKYAVSEQLDGRTCPVCREMHGRVFEVQRTKANLEAHLSVTDPDDLKMLAPWPKQDLASVAALSNMSNDEIMAAGWATPPYHPLCRGILVKTEDVLHIDRIETRRPGPDLATPQEGQGDTGSKPTSLSSAELATALLGGLTTDLLAELDKRLLKG